MRNLIELKGLRNVISTPYSEPFPFIHRFTQYVDEKDRDAFQVLVHLELSADFISIHFGHIEVQQYELRPVFSSSLEGESSAGHSVDGKTLV